MSILNRKSTQKNIGKEALEKDFCLSTQKTILWDFDEKKFFPFLNLLRLSKLLSLLVNVVVALRGFCGKIPTHSSLQELNWSNYGTQKANTNMLLMTFSAFQFLPPQSHHAHHVTQKCRKNVFNLLFLLEHHHIVAKALRWKSRKLRKRKTQKPLSITQFVEKGILASTFENEVKFNLLLNTFCWLFFIVKEVTEQFTNILIPQSI